MQNGTDFRDEKRPARDLPVTLYMHSFSALILLPCCTVNIIETVSCTGGYS